MMMLTYRCCCCSSWVDVDVDVDDMAFGFVAQSWIVQECCNTDMDIKRWCLGEIETVLEWEVEDRAEKGLV